MSSSMLRHSCQSLRPQLLRTSSIVRSRYSSHGASNWNEPSGNLFGEKTLHPGQKRKWEDWEALWYFGMFGGMAAAAIGLYYKPDTSIGTWAMKEAKQRMEARGDATDYRPSA